MGLPKGTIHNIVNTLERGGFLQQDQDTKKYGLGPNLFTLGTIMAGTLEINQKAAGPAQDLARRTGLSCRIAVWDRDAALVTLDVVPQHAESLAPRIGPRVVAYCSAIGRALLVYLESSQLESYLEQTEMIPYTVHTITQRDELLRELERTRNRGYAINNQELAPGRASIASTILKTGSLLAASISLTGAPDHLLGAAMEGLAMELRSTAAEVSRYMGYIPSEPALTRRGQAGN